MPRVTPTVMAMMTQLHGCRQAPGDDGGNGCALPGHGIAEVTGDGVLQVDQELLRDGLIQIVLGIEHLPHLRGELGQFTAEGGPGYDLHQEECNGCECRQGENSHRQALECITKH